MKHTWNLTKSAQGHLVDITVKLKGKTEFDQICTAVQAAIEVFRPSVLVPASRDASLNSIQSGNSTVPTPSHLTEGGYDTFNEESDSSQG